MLTCEVCHAKESREAMVDEIFWINGKYVRVDHIPATVCVRCGEETFSRETTETIRQMVHGRAEPTKFITLEVFKFTDTRKI